MGTAAPTREKLETVLKDRSLLQDIKELTSAIHRGGQEGIQEQDTLQGMPFNVLICAKIQDIFRN